MKYQGLLYPCFLLCLVSLSNCGGGSGGGGTPTDPDKVFSLEKLNSLQEGEVYRAELKGLTYEDKKSYPTTATYIYTNRARENIDISGIGAITVTPRHVHEAYTSGASESEYEYIYYYDADKYLVRVVGDFDNKRNWCYPSTPSSTSRYPDTVKVGDSGSLGEYTCRPSDVEVSFNWQARDGFNGHLLFDYISVFKYQNALAGTWTTTFKLDGDGNILGISVVSTHIDGRDRVTDMTLSSY